MFLSFLVSNRSTLKGQTWIYIKVEIISDNGHLLTTYYAHVYYV